MGDHELLQRYADSGSNEAFAELVRRHLNLVYSAARRQVGSAQIAEEVTQAVFFDLSRSARKLKAGQPLAAWLFLVTRRTAIDARRREARRLAREQAVLETTDMNKPSPSWRQIEPLLDEAVAALNEMDRRAVLLRFFENKSLRDVGKALGASDDAAQKRVTRAVEELRMFFGRHGVTVSAASLVVVLPSQAVQAAPASVLGTLLSSTSLLTATATHVSEIIVMTTLKKIGLSTVLALAVGAGIYEVRENWIRSNDARAMQRSIDALLLENRELRASRGEVDARLAGVEAELASARALATAGDPAIELALEAWLERVQSMKRWLEKMPDKRIPQMSLLTEEDWLGAAKTAKVDNELGAREALAQLRQEALKHFSTPLRAALDAYIKDNGNELPKSAALLLPYFNPPIDAAMLGNFEIVEAQLKVVEIRGQQPPRYMLANMIVDDFYDFQIGLRVGGSTTMQVQSAHNAVLAAVRAYRKANNGQRPQISAQLTPYLEKPIAAAYMERVFPDALK